MEGLFWYWVYAVILLFIAAAAGVVGWEVFFAFWIGIPGLVFGVSILLLHVTSWAAYARQRWREKRNLTEQ